MTKMQWFGLGVLVLFFIAVPLWGQQQTQPSQAASEQEIQELRQIVLKLQAEVDELNALRASF